MPTGRVKGGSDEGKRILNNIRRLVRALRLFDREAKSKFGLSAAQMFVLHALDGEEEPLSLNELAERTATDQSSSSVVVQKLVEAGYVTRTQRKEDRRHIELRLTPKGRTLARRAPAPAQEKILASVEALSRADRTKLADLLDAFVDGMDAGTERPPMLFEDR